MKNGERMITMEKETQRTKELALAGEDIICFAGEDWWYHNPHSNLHIMKSLARKNRILFVNSIGVRMPDLKTDKFAWKKITSKLKSLMRYLQKAEPNIWVLTPFALPLIENHERSIQKINKFLLVLQMKLVMMRIHFRNPILWVCVPTVKDVALALRKKAKCLVYYCVDNISFYTGSINDYILELETDLHAKADLAFFVNHTLVEERRENNPATMHLSHGVDFEHFAGSGEKEEVPADLAKITRPTVAYIGALRGLDWELVEWLARRNPQLAFVFIGEVLEDLGRLADLNNIHFLGKKTYEDLPRYMRHVDCFAIFYKNDDVFNNYRNPKKLLEYFAVGKPVISVPILELTHFGDLVYTAHDRQAFNALLRQAVEGDPEDLKARRVKYAETHTWDHAAAEASSKISEVLRG